MLKCASRLGNLSKKGKTLKNRPYTDTKPKICSFCHCCCWCNQRKMGFVHLSVSWATSCYHTNSHRTRKEVPDVFARVGSRVEFEIGLRNSAPKRFVWNLCRPNTQPYNCILRLYSEKLKDGDIDLDLDVAVRETAQDFFDASKEELMQFKLASRVTGITLNLHWWFASGKL